MSYLIIAAIALAVVVYACFRIRFWIAEGARMQESGHLCPPPSVFARAFLAVTTRLLVYLCIGPIKVIGKQNYRKAKRSGRVIYTPTHTFELDFALVRAATWSCFRYMTTTSELKGIRGAFGAWTGAIPVNVKVPGGGEKAVDASIEAVEESEKSRLLIFPPGKLLPESVLERKDFKNGFARIAKAVQQETEGPLSVVPMYLHYNRDRSQAPFSHHFLKAARRAFGVTNYGATVVVGEPIEASALPVDADAATDLIYNRIRELQQIALKGQQAPQPSAS